MLHWILHLKSLDWRDILVCFIVVVIILVINIALKTLYFSFSAIGIDCVIYVYNICWSGAIVMKDWVMKSLLNILCQDTCLQVPLFFSSCKNKKHLRDRGEKEKKYICHRGWHVGFPSKYPNTHFISLDSIVMKKCIYININNFRSREKDQCDSLV